MDDVQFEGEDVHTPVRAEAGTLMASIEGEDRVELEYVYIPGRGHDGEKARKIYWRFG
jgi:hypothetical protein